MRPIDADAYAAELWKLRENYQMLDDTHTADKIMHGIFRAEQVLKEQPTVAAPRWHRVEEELPNEFDTVIVCGRMKYDHEKDYEVFVDAAEYGAFDYAHDRWVTWNDWHEGQEEFKITHWMPLPEPPKEDA